MSILSDEITNDPTGKGYASLLPDQPGHVVDLLNARTETKVGVIIKAELARWAAKTGMRHVIEQEAADLASPLRSSALSIIDVLRGASDGIDLSIPDNMAILDGWEAASKLSAEHKALMILMATKPASRAEVLGLPYITEDLLRSR